jgi:hypothetical protein
MCNLAAALPMIRLPRMHSQQRLPSLSTTTWAHEVVSLVFLPEMKRSRGHYMDQELARFMRNEKNTTVKRRIDAEMLLESCSRACISSCFVHDDVDRNSTGIVKLVPIGWIDVEVEFLNARHLGLNPTCFF